jgi:hypothetical protein
MSTSKPDPDAARRLAVMLADAAAARQRGRPSAIDADAARELIAELSADGVDGIDALLVALSEELRARGATLPPPEQLPPGLASLLEAADEALSPGADGQIDLEQAARKLDRAVGATLGTSPREARERAMRERIRREVGESIARSMRAHGLTPAADMKDDDEPT